MTNRDVKIVSFPIMYVDEDVLINDYLKRLYINPEGTEIPKGSTVYFEMRIVLPENEIIEVEE